ncbi:alpha/beta hydrolase [Saccharopolyspora rosea]|uniref:Alpha/beta hydrolase n=1 Tax=Saccharopolyspora rosea TaxID=524884 RepID=A0ABW3G3B6_9PSEU|nr:esterase family protein [Saccharopolyspora rosea]
MDVGHPPGGGGFGAGDHRGVSLLSGWLPVTVQIVVVLLLLAAIGWRTRRWRVLWVPVAAGAGVAGALAVLAWFDDSGLATDPAPTSLWVWIGVTAGSLVVLVAGWRGARWWRRGLSVLVVPLCLLCVALVLNQWVGYFRTISQAWGTITAGPLPGQVSEADLPALRGEPAPTGRVVAVTTPDTASQFPHRQEYVYLPPAWFAGAKPPALPAIMMIGGEFNTAADWVRAGDVLPVIDHYAQTHGGYAPVLVFVDAGGTFNNDTECVDGPRGNAADHLTEDVRPYVTSHFGVPAASQAWGVVGWSMGGTCAADLAVMHPELFDSFVDIAGDPGPNTGTKQQTIQRLYGGDAAAWARFDPMTVLGHHAPYPDTAGWFDDSAPGYGPRGRRGWSGGGETDPQQKEAGIRRLCATATAKGIRCSVHTYQAGHTWQFASKAFADSLPWLDSRIKRLPEKTVATHR